MNVGKPKAAGNSLRGCRRLVVSMLLTFSQTKVSQVKKYSFKLLAYILEQLFCFVYHSVNHILSKGFIMTTKYRALECLITCLDLFKLFSIEIHGSFMSVLQYCNNDPIRIDSCACMCEACTVVEEIITQLSLMVSKQ